LENLEEMDKFLYMTIQNWTKWILIP
jgi:hypothetical protein